MTALRDRFWERPIETLNRAEWEALLQFLHSQWKGNWVNTDRPNLLKRGK